MSWVDILANIPTNAVLRQKLGELTAEFEALEYRIVELERENVELKAQLEGDDTELHDIEIQILEFLGKAGKYIDKNSFLTQLQMPPAKAEHYLNSLRDKGYLKAQYNMMTGASYNLSQKGSNFLIETGRL
ncbi:MULTISPECIES: hypothetical protein [unclassified Halomonas]|uniref:hypothetical protein n=1 Tax=unclassified Halomonas TaxID=2609666 RepID=UPI00048627BC|nr:MULTISPECIES: hypothetical protein [unclassified Halomonas]PKH59883.1 hypothetical protein CXF94_19765 [Halomonas sp. Choline-3u-9]QGQ70289.1 hypothetical protein FDY98_09970 [Halomonas sp. PA16-9]